MNQFFVAHTKKETKVNILRWHALILAQIVFTSCCNGNNLFFFPVKNSCSLNNCEIFACSLVYIILQSKTKDIEMTSTHTDLKVFPADDK